MNPNYEIWQDKARKLKNPLLSQSECNKIRAELQLVNINGLSMEDYQLLMGNFN